MLSKVKQWLEHRRKVRAIKKDMARCRLGIAYATTTENLKTYAFFHEQYRKELDKLKQQ